MGKAKHKRHPRRGCGWASTGMRQSAWAEQVTGHRSSMLHLPDGKAFFSPFRLTWEIFWLAEGLLMHELL